MDLSPSTQGEQKNEQPQQVSSHSPSAQHTSWPSTVYVPHSSHSETDEYSIASSSQTTPAGSQYLDFNKMYQELIEVSPKWYNLGLALGLDTGTLNIIEHDNKECETCLRKALDN